jgi:hypothetical protein
MEKRLNQYRLIPTLMAKSPLELKSGVFKVNVITHFRCQAKMEHTTPYFPLKQPAARAG